MIGLVLALAAQAVSPSRPMVADPVQLHRIDVTFQCPETLPSEKAKIEALARFDHDVSAAVQDLTAARLGEIRTYLLKKHGCRQTLANMQSNQ